MSSDHQEIPSTTRRLTAVLALTITIGCVGSGDLVSGVTVRDSAGVRIVESASPLWREGDGWRLDHEPEFAIGSASGDAPYELFDVRDAVRLDDGRIVVANAGTQELRFYDNHGVHLRTVGGKGGGPGEFNELRWMRLWRDTVIAYDPFPPRLLYFDLAGDFVRSVLYKPMENNAFAYPIDVFADGVVLAYGPNPDLFPPPGLLRRDMALVRSTADGHVDTIAVVPGSESYVQHFGNGGRSFATPIFRKATYPFAHGDNLIVASNDTYELRRFDIAGRLTEIIRKTHENLEVTPRDVELQRQSMLSRITSQAARERYESQYYEMPIPETMPAFGWTDMTRTPPVRADDQGNLWVLDYSRPGEERYRWSVFDPGGQWLVTVDVGFALEPLHIGTDFVLGLVKDEYDVQQLRFYRLIKP
jgi:hypothetical protein